MSDPSPFSTIRRGEDPAMPKVPAISSGLPVPPGRRPIRARPLVELGWGPPFEAAFASRLRDGCCARPRRPGRPERPHGAHRSRRAEGLSRRSWLTILTR